MAEKRDTFTYEDLKRKPGDLIESRDWNTAMWAIEEVHTHLTTLGNAVPRKSGANTLTGPLTIKDTLTVDANVVIRGSGMTSPDATLEVAEAVKVGTNATINGTLTVTEQVRLQKNAIPEGTNDCQLEISSPNTGKTQDYTRIRFQQTDQYGAWLGYHGLSSANQAGEFVFFDLHAQKEAHVRTGALTCTGDASLGGNLEVSAGTLKVKGRAEFGDIVTAKDVHLDGASVAEMLRNLAAREESQIAMEIVVYQFQPNTTNIEVTPNGQTVSLRGLTVPVEPDMPMAKEQILSLHGVVEIPVQCIPPTEGASISGTERLLCQVVSLTLEPVYTWPQPQDAAQHWSLRAIEITAPPWARSDHDLAKEWRRRQRTRQDLSTLIATLRNDPRPNVPREIAVLQAKLEQLDATMERWKHAPGSVSNTDQSTAGSEVEDQQKEQLEAQLDTLITTLWDREKQALGSPIRALVTAYTTLQNAYDQKKKDILKETVDSLLSGQPWLSSLHATTSDSQPTLADVKLFNTYEDLYAWVRGALSANTTRDPRDPWINIAVQYGQNIEMQANLRLSTQTVAGVFGGEQIKNALLDPIRDRIDHAKAELEERESMFRVARREGRAQAGIPDDLDPKWQQLWTQLDQIERVIAAQRRTLPVPVRASGVSELAPWTLRLRITYATRMATPRDWPPVPPSRGLPTRVPMRLTA